VALTHKLSGTITLDAPAPPGGASIALSSVPAPDGAVTFDSNPVQIAEGGTTAAFTITGSQLGALAINAVAAGYNAGRQNVQVVILGAVSIPGALTVASGQSTPLRVQLSAPAPTDGVTVTLASSDTSKVTVAPSTVNIRAGATTPDPQPQISGVAQTTGDAIVTATAGGFYSDQQTVKVIASITFKEQAVSVGPGGVKGFTILLSAPAPTGGLLVYLTSSNESVATTPASGALVPAGQQSVDSQVTGVNVGSADITLSTNPSIPGNQYFSGAGAVLNVSVARPAIRITTDTLQPGIAGATYPSTTLAATGGTGLGYFWTIATGSLPSGLNLNTSGVLSGSLSSSATTSTFTVQVQDGGGNKDTKTFTITVTSPLTITTESLPTGVAGSTYQAATLTATGGSGSGYTWSLASGSLPASLTLSAGGVISGDVSNSAVGSTFTIQVQDGAGKTTVKSFTISISVQLAITTASVPAGTAGASYTTTSLQASGGTGSGYSWSLVNSSLPSGLILSTAGAISGTLSKTATTSTFTVQVKDSGNNVATIQFTLTVNAALTITAATLPNGITGADYPATTLAATGGSGSGYSWTVSTGALPAGLTLSSGGVFSGTVSNSASTSTFTVRVQDSGGATAVADFTITVFPGLTVTTTSLPAGVAGSVYPTKFLAASGGSGNGYTWSVSSGTLPAGLTLTSAGMLSGTLSDSASASTFTVQVQDSAHNTGTKTFTLSVNAALQITTSTLPGGAGGALYSSTTLAASGGSGSGYTWSVSAGSLPSGLTLNAGGVLSGTLAANATSATFTAQVKDDAQNTASRQFTITVALTVTTASLPAGDAGKSYSTLLTAAGGTGAGYTWSVSAGSLPATLTLSTGGALSGTIASSSTTSTFTVQVQDSGGTAVSKQFTLTVNPPLTITTATLPAGTTGAAYPTTTLLASGGSNSGYMWSISSGLLPGGLTMSTGGVISGTVSTSATSATFTVQVQDGGGNTATRQYTLSVETNLAITTTSLPDGVISASYPSTTLSAGGGTGTGYAWSIPTGSLPAGLTLSADGVVSGTVSTSAQTSTFTLQVKDSANHVVTKQFTITIHPALSISTASLPTGTAGSAYPTTTLTATGGSGTGYVWSISTGTLPPNLALSADGAISGTISSSAGSATLTICVRDSLSVTVCKQFTITVNPTLTITTPSLPAGMATATYPSTTLAATGGTGSGYTWSVSVGSLPTGLTLTGGVLSGTLGSSAATATFTIQVQDSASNVATKQYTLTVYPALTITTSALPTGIAGNVYPSTTLTASGGSNSGYTWSLASGTLPANLTLSSGGVLSGTLLSSASSASVTIQVKDSVGNTATQVFSLTVNPALTITTASLPDGTAGTGYTPTTMAAVGGTGSSYTWSVSAGTLPSGLTLTPAGALSGTLSSSATSSNVTIQVKDSGNNVATKQFSITILAGLGVFTAVLPDGIAGAAYGPATLTATGGTGTGFTWSISAGTLPSALTLSSGGVLSGTLAANAVTSTFTVQVKDSANNVATREFTLTVKPVLTIGGSTLPTGTAGSDYPSTTLTASGGTGGGYLWSLSNGALPNGLNLSTGGVITGTLGASAITTTFTVQVKDSGNNIATKQFTLTVNPTLQITTGSLPAGTAGVAYTSTTLAASGGTNSGFTWSVTNGLLPAGLTLSSGGVLSGTLTSAATTSTFTIQVQDNGGNTGRKQFTIAVTLLVTTSTLPGGTAGSAYAGATLAASGGTGAGYTWSLASGTLPAGLTLSTGGVLSGNFLSSATTSTFTVQVQDSGSTTATKQLTISVASALVIDTTSLPASMAGTAYPSTTLSASGGTASGYTWSVSLGSLPSGLTLSGGVISGTLASGATTATFTLQVKDSGNNIATRQLTLTVYPVLSITTGSLPTGTAGNAYASTNLDATGGTASGYTWSVTVGTLPTGLTLSSAGVISGTLGSAAVSATFTVQVQDSASNKATKQFTLTVNPTLSITPATLPGGMAGAAYPSTTLTASGGSLTGYAWSVTVGSLPTGLTMTSGGVISGTLGSAATTATFTVQVQDSVLNIATRQFTITVVPTIAITTPSLPSGMAGAAYPSTTLAASGGTASGYTWSITAGILPSGLTLSSAGVLSGTLGSSATTATVTVQVQDSGSNKATKPFLITVYPALSVTTPSLPDGLAGTAYTSTTLAATGGSGTGYTWSISADLLPSGLTLNSGGVLSGTLSQSATTATFTVQVQDSVSNTATKQFTLTVVPTLTITTPSLPNGFAGSVYPTTTLASSGGSGTGYTYTLASGLLPNGLILSSGGAISGTVNASATTSTFTIQVKDSANHTANHEFTITISAALAISAATLPTGVAGSSYPSTPLSATGGTGTGYTWSVTVGSLPGGLTLSSGGAISGTLDASATSANFTVQVKDSGNNTATRAFTLTVNPAVTITTPSIPNGMAGIAYTSTTLAASGGTGTGYTWSLSTGALPTGLTLSTGGVLSGTLDASAATATFSVKAQDSGSNSATRTYTLTVYPALTITTASLGGGTAGLLYTTATLAATGGSGTGYTWSLASGSLPSGLTLSAGGSITGTLATSAVSTTFTVQVKDSVNNAVTKQFTITVATPPLAFVTGATLPTSIVGTAYNTTIVAVGGTQPYGWSSTDIPSWLTLDSTGAVCGAAGAVCGTPPTVGQVTFTVKVIDSAIPSHQISQVFSLTTTGAGGLGTITVPAKSVGVNLQTPIDITLSPPTSRVTILTIRSGNSAAVLLGNAFEAGLSPYNITLPANTSSVQLYVKALAAATPVTLTASTDVDYANGTGVVTITNSGFVLASPSGTGADFTTYQGVITGLTVYPYRLGTNNIPAENQPIRGGLSVNCPIAVAPTTLGSMGSPSVAFTGGDTSAAALFTASFTNSGTASITLSPPVGSSFISPATGGTLNATIQSSGFVVPNGFTIGRNLQKALVVGLTGTAGLDTIVTIKSSDVNALKFATSLTGAGTESIQVVIGKGFSATPTFYARAYGSSGSVQYTVSASTYGSVTSSIPMGPSGFVINSPAGQGADFSITVGSPDPTLDVQTALYTTSGTVVELQYVVPDTSITAAVTSWTPSVGTVSPASVVVAGGTYSKSFTFHALAVGSTNITASATGYTTGAVKATLGNVQVFLNPVDPVGQFLAVPGLVNLSSPATTTVPVTLNVTSGAIKLAANATDAGSNSITINVTPGNTNATFWVYGMASTGTGTYTATALGSTSAPDTVTLAPSGIVLYMGAAGNPSCFGTGGFQCSVGLTGGAKSVFVLTYMLNVDGTLVLNGGRQPLAGSQALTIPLSNSAPSVGSAPASVSIAGGTSVGSFNFTPSTLGRTILALGSLNGWTTPTFLGFDWSQLGINVQ
jgi:hypothetical protein